MNVYRFRKICNLSNVYKIRSAHNLAKADSEIELLTKQETRISQSSVGITVASVENYSPLSEVSVVVKAGSRHESATNLGIVHCLRNSAVLSTKNLSAFALTRNLELIGAKLGVTTTREHIIYTLQCVRDDIDKGLEILADVTNKQAFKVWEVADAASRMNVDLAFHTSNPESVLLEALHKASFKGGLGNGIYSPGFMIGKHDSSMLHSFIDNYFTTSRTAVVGLGVPHEHLQNSVDKLFQMSDPVKKDESSKFVAREHRIEENIPYVHTAIVAEGASFANNKEMLSLRLLQCILGLGSHLKLSTSKFSKLGEAAAKQTNSPFFVSSINLNYSDTGLFGVYIVGDPNEMHKIVKAVVTQMRSVTKSISESDIEIAKKKLKSQILFERETNSKALSEMALDVSHFGKIIPNVAVEKSIDELKSADVATIATKVMKAKPAMAALGRLHCTPHIDELV